MIDHGHNGSLFETQQEALEILLRLNDDPVLRKTIGRAARETMEAVYSSSRTEIVNYYLRGNVTKLTAELL